MKDVENSTKRENAMISRFEKFMYDITEIDLYLHQITTSVMKQFDLKGSYAVYFTKLRSFPEGLTAVELGAKCGRDKADISRDIRALEQAGFVKRVKTGESSYRARIMLTDRGNRLTEEIVKKAKLAVSVIGRDLTDYDRVCFYRVLDNITKNLRSLSQEGFPE